MHADRDIGIHLHRRLNQMAQDNVVGVGARAPARLQNNRRVGFFGGHHDRQHLLHIVDIESRNAVIVFRRVVQ
jgi:hypothetical protein